MTRRRFLTLALVLVAGTLAASCKSSAQRYVFKPRPLVIDVPAPDGSSIVARAVAVVVGVRPGDAKEGRRDEIVLRLSLENQSSRPIAFDPRAWKLVSADLRSFGQPVVDIQAPSDSELGSEIPPGAELTLELAFPVALGEELDTYDLSGLNLRFGVRYGDATIVPSATFERWLRAPYDPYPYGYWGPHPYYYSVSSGVSFGAGISISD